ncbi:ATP-binding protein [Caulobacter sp.]|uniref:ATP-binding protein n=1 Tax=Caulobacter sp. TaxID=78 RepID=UPI0031CDC565
MLSLRRARLRERIGLIVLVHLCAMILVVFAFTAGADSRKMAPFYRLPDPEKAALITAAFEHAPPNTHPGLVRAFSDSALRVRLLAALPPAAPDTATAQTLERYSKALGGRPFRIEVSSDAGPASLRRTALSSDAMRVVVALADGHAVSIEQRVTAPITKIFNNIVAFGLAIVVVDLVFILWLASQTTRPVERLARAVREDRLEAVEPGGPREIVELTEAFRSLRARLDGFLQERTRMLAAIAHDYRTYLTRLQLRTEFITDDRQRDLAAADVEEMRVLLADTLTFAHESARAEADGAVCDLREELSLIAAEREDRGEDIRVDRLEEAIFVHASHVSFQRMLANLLDNAVRYGGGRAAVRVQVEGELVHLCVDDDGPGVPEESLSRMLEPFERMEPSRARQTGGTGLGLSIVQALAHRYRGTLVLRNRPEGGFRALLTLPLAGQGR